uniref:Cystatin domain-containing protein n=1 Tax=Micrurus lemniscatus lemniscatus TaxID=129467 RepID=A0A2D4IJA9_MICLE
MFFGWRETSLLCFLLLYGVPNPSTGAPGQFPNSLIRPGAPFPVKTSDPNVQRAARLGVYRYNNRSNDIFLFKESRINNATEQIVEGVIYRLNVDIRRTECRKGIPHPNLDRCAFQKEKMLNKKLTCDFEVWFTPGEQNVHIPVMLCR